MLLKSEQMEFPNFYFLIITFPFNFIVLIFSSFSCLNYICYAPHADLNLSWEYGHAHVKKAQVFELSNE
jgi:hypothetical protein